MAPSHETIYYALCSLHIDCNARGLLIDFALREERESCVARRFYRLTMMLHYY